MTHRFCRGSLALDFVGTVGSRASSQPVERIPDETEFLSWLRAARLVEDDVPTPERERYHAALALREAIARIGYAIERGDAPSDADIARLNAAARGSGAGTFALETPTLRKRIVAVDPIEFALGRIADDAIEIFANAGERLFRCEAPTCTALLLSSARGERRRWCSMETCGNRAKVAAHRERRRRASREPT